MLLLAMTGAGVEPLEHPPRAQSAWLAGRNRLTVEATVRAECSPRGRPRPPSGRTLAGQNDVSRPAAGWRRNDRRTRSLSTMAWRWLRDRLGRS
jgi:hypothetical protein